MENIESDSRRAVPKEESYSCWQSCWIDHIVQTTHEGTQRTLAHRQEFWWFPGGDRPKRIRLEGGVALNIERGAAAPGNLKRTITIKRRQQNEVVAMGI
ncbi:MAG: hypothetical protein QM718_05810 [Steroidobacteraceae bacterium]